MIVPKSLRPPSRFEPFEDRENMVGKWEGKFKCTGAYHNPREGELYWGHLGVARCQWFEPSFPRFVILERVK